MWKLCCERGRQWWEFDANSTDASRLEEIERAREGYTRNRHEAAHSCDRILRAQAAAGELEGNPTGGKLCAVPRKLLDEKDELGTAIHKGIAYFATLQMGDGHWPGDYGGPMFLLPGLIIACRITGTELGAARGKEMMRYLRNHQNNDGGFGLHIEHKSGMFATALSYVSLRILGLSADDPTCTAARAWIERNGGAGGVPGWGKFWLAVLGVYDWDGLDPLTPEFWLLPYAVPVHPARFWCHCRMVYLPMSYIYGRRAVGPVDDLVLGLREELYGMPYSQVEWWKHRGDCCSHDVYVARPRLQRLLWAALIVFEKMPFPGKAYLRNRALQEVLQLIRVEDESTNYIDIGPVNKAINFLCVWFNDPHDPAVKKHADRIKDYLWLAEDGMKMQGYNGSQLWDTAFAAQALLSVDRELLEPFVKTLSLAHNYIEVTQVRTDVPDREQFYRHRSKGAWPFSTVDHGWPISDCTGEGLKAALRLQNESWIPIQRKISEDRLQGAADMLLSYQNSDGGWATYELARGSPLLEFLNPSEVFGDIMIEYSCCECSASSLTGLVAFRNSYPSYRREEIDRSICRGISFIKSVQENDGSWYGSWGVCYLYGTFFGVSALCASGEDAQSSTAVRRACEFLLSKQRDDGSWGESYLSCQDKIYTQAREGQVVGTAWGLISLAKANWWDPVPFMRGARFLIQSQEPTGDWPQQLVSGVFNRNCVVSYSQYRNIFPIWALAECSHRLQNLRNSRDR